MWTTQVVLSLLMVLVALTSYLKADHFTVGPKGAIVRAASSTITKQTTEEEKALSTKALSTKGFSPDGTVGIERRGRRRRVSCDRATDVGTLAECGQ